MNLTRIPALSVGLYSGYSWYQDKIEGINFPVDYYGYKAGLTIEGNYKINRETIFYFNNKLEGTWAGGNGYASDLFSSYYSYNIHKSFEEDLITSVKFISDKSTSFGPLFGLNYKYAKHISLDDFETELWLDTDNDGFADSIVWYYESYEKWAYTDDGIKLSLGIDSQFGPVNLKGYYRYNLEKPERSHVFFGARYDTDILSPSILLGSRKDFKELSYQEYKLTLLEYFYIKYDREKYTEPAIPTLNSLSCGFNLIF